MNLPGGKKSGRTVLRMDNVKKDLGNPVGAHMHQHLGGSRPGLGPQNPSFPVKVKKPRF